MRTTCQGRQRMTSFETTSGDGPEGEIAPAAPPVEPSDAERGPALADPPLDPGGLAAEFAEFADLSVPDVPPPTLDDPDADNLTPDERERLQRKRDDEQHRIDLARQEEHAEDDEMGRQKRQNVRVDVQYPIVLRLDGRESLSRTRDLSATGVGFSTRFPIDRDQGGEVTIDFPDWKFTKRFVARFIKPILAGWQVGAQFDDLTVEERERLVKEVFNVQRSQLQSRR